MNFIDKKSYQSTRIDDGTSELACEFRGVSKEYGGSNFAVRALNLTVSRGEFLSLLGPSGSGKTTTLMMLAGFERPSEGTIMLGGQDITDLPAHRRGLGVVFQSYALFPHMTVAENVAFPLTVRRVRPDDARTRVGRALDLVKLKDLGDRFPRQLSGGQQQRVALARALVFDPSLILMDEPLGALDRQLREHMQLEISRLHQQLGVTVVYVTHDQGEAMAMSDRVAVFDGGRVLQVASPLDVYDRPAHPFVAKFVGENNHIIGTVQHVAQECCTVRLSDGSLIFAAYFSSLTLGETVFVSLRPESLRCGRGQAGWNSLTGRIDQLTFRGDHVRLCVKSAATGDVYAKLARGDDFSPMAPGELITLSWEPRSCLAIPTNTDRHTTIPRSTNGV